MELLSCLPCPHFRHTSLNKIRSKLWQISNSQKSLYKSIEGQDYQIWKWFLFISCTFCDRSQNFTFECIKFHFGSHPKIIRNQDNFYVKFILHMFLMQLVTSLHNLQLTLCWKSVNVMYLEQHNWKIPLQAVLIPVTCVVGRLILCFRFFLKIIMIFSSTLQNNQTLKQNNWNS